MSAYAEILIVSIPAKSSEKSIEQRMKRALLVAVSSVFLLGVGYAAVSGHGNNLKSYPAVRADGATGGATNCGGTGQLCKP